MVTTVEELLNRQCQLETEVSQLKETVLRLSHRVVVLENFIKSKHGSLPIIPVPVAGDIASYVPSISPVSLASSCQDNRQNETVDLNSKSTSQQQLRQTSISSRDAPPKADHSESAKASIPQKTGTDTILASKDPQHITIAPSATDARSFQPKSPILVEYNCVSTPCIQHQKGSEVLHSNAIHKAVVSGPYNSNSLEGVTKALSNSGNNVPETSPSVEKKIHIKDTREVPCAKDDEDALKVIQDEVIPISEQERQPNPSTEINQIRGTIKANADISGSSKNVLGTSAKVGVPIAASTPSSSNPTTTDVCHPSSPKPHRKSNPRSDIHQNQNHQDSSNVILSKSQIKREDSIKISEPSEVKSLPVRPANKELLVDIGLQTDLEEDPEIYYFAGGRHVGSQTDCDDGEYEPLIPFVANTKLEIIVLTSSPPGPCVSSTTSLPEIESSATASSSNNLVEVKESKAKGVSFQPTTTSTATTATATASTTTTARTITAPDIRYSAGDAETGKINKLPTPDVKVDQIINASLNRNSSGGKLKDETQVTILRGSEKEKVEKDGWKTVTARSNRTKWSQSSSSLGSSAANSSRGSLDRSSIGDYRESRDRGSIGSGSHSGSVRGRLNSSGSCQVGSGVNGGSRGSPSQSHHNSSSNCSGGRQQRNNLTCVNNIRENPAWKVCGPARGSISNASSSANYLKSRFYQPSSTISLPVLNDPHDDRIRLPDGKRAGPGYAHSSSKKPSEVESGYGSREKLCKKKTSLAANLDVCGSPNKPKPQRPASQQRSTQTTKKPGMSVGVGHSVASKVLRDETTSTGAPIRKLRSEVSTATSASLASTINFKQRTTAISSGGKTASSQFSSASSLSGSVPPSSKLVNNVKPADINKERSFASDNRLNAKKKVDSSSINAGPGIGGSRVTKGSGPGSNIGSPSSTSSLNKTTTTTTSAVFKKPISTGLTAKHNSSNSNSSLKNLGSGSNVNHTNTTKKATGKYAEKVTDAHQLAVEAEPMRDQDSEVDSEMIVNSNDKWKEEKDTESSNDDEEIQRKEAALESVIKESELLAEELLQVEKDFEEIENRPADNVSVDEASVVSDGCETTSSPSTFPESETETEMSDFCSDLDQFFFIAINNDRNSPLNSMHIDETIEERIVAKKEKLRLSPTKKCDSAETLKRHRAKLAKAERNRERLLQAKYNRYVELSERFACLNETTKRLVEERSELTAKADERRKRAAEKRKLHLKSIVKKAHDEDSKAKEIAFINLLEAQNKRHDYLANVQEVEDRLNSIQEERKLKFEDRAVKVQAVIERQGHIRHGWETKLDAMQEKRRKINERIMREKEERAKERSELAQEKARDREERISALNAAKQAEKEELQKKILQKQQETARRHEENIEQIRQKAIELTLPRTPEDTGPVTVRMCSLCKVTMQSEVQELAHLRGRSHLDAVRKMEQDNGGSKIEQFGLKFITDVQVDKIEPGIRHDKNRSKKHCKKLMLKLITNGEEFEKAEQELRFDKPWGDPTLKAKVLKNLRELERACSLFSCGKGTLSIANSMDKLLAEIRRTINKNKSVQDAIVGLKAFSVVSKILQCSAPDLPPKILIGACNLIVGATYQHLLNGVYVLRSTVICSLIDLVVGRLNSLIPDGNRWLTNSPIESNESLQADSVADFAIETFFTLLSIVPDPFDGITRQKDLRIKDSDILDITYRTQDIIGYLVAANVIDRLSVYCSSVQGPVDNQPGVANLLNISLDFLTALVWCLTFCLERRSGLNGGKREVDPTQLLAALESSELAGSVSMSYALLLYQGAPTRPRLVKQADSEISLEDTSLQSYNNNCSSPPPPPGSRTASVVKSTLCLVNAVARLDIQALQNVLGSEAVSLQFRHIASQLLWQVVPHREDRAMWGLLQELFIAIGNFTVKNLHNQVTIQSGQTPTVLQQLCVVAKEFLSDVRVSRSILPTLIAATHGCPENRELLIQENFPIDLLDGFLESKFSCANIILKRLVSPPPSSGLTSSNSSSSTTLGK